MAKPTITFADPRTGALALIRAKVPGVTAGATIPRAETVPFILVGHDATLTRYPVDEAATVRVTCYHTSSANAVALAQTVRAHLLSTKGTAHFRASRSLTGPVPVVDPDSGQQMATFTVALHMRPSVV